MFLEFFFKLWQIAKGNITITADKTRAHLVEFDEQRNFDALYPLQQFCAPKSSCFTILMKVSEPLRTLVKG